MNLTVSVSLEWDPEIRVAPVEENSVLDTSLNDYLKCQLIEYFNQKAQTGWRAAKTPPVYMLSTTD